MNKRVLIYSYYSPEELTGIGKYNGELIDYLMQHEIEVISISSAPFYPHWKLYQGFDNSVLKRMKSKLLNDYRSYVYIPKKPSSLRKVLSEISLYISSILSWMLVLNKLHKTSLIIVINPPFFYGIRAIIIKVFLKTKVLLHIQDLQVDAAIDLGLLPVFLSKTLRRIERVILNNATYISTISKGMKEKILKKGIRNDIFLLPNWSNLDTIYPKENEFFLHQKAGIAKDKMLIVYSGNIGHKQGLEIIIEAAKKLIHHTDLHFLILGEGLYKIELEALIVKENANNVSLGTLVNQDQLNDMLNSSFIQLVIQKSEGADSFLPSKLTNILSAGCCSIVTAESGTSLYSMLAPSNSAMVIKPDSSEALSTAIRKLTIDKKRYNQIRKNARKLAVQTLGIDSCLAPLLKIISA